VSQKTAFVTTEMSTEISEEMTVPTSLAAISKENYSFALKVLEGNFDYHAVAERACRATLSGKG
jgi:hypothetical protein